MKEIINFTKKEIKKISRQEFSSPLFGDKVMALFTIEIKEVYNLPHIQCYRVLRYKMNCSTCLKLAEFAFHAKAKSACLRSTCLRQV